MGLRSLCGVRIPERMEVLDSRSDTVHAGVNAEVSGVVRVSIQEDDR